MSAQAAICLLSLLPPVLRVPAPSVPAPRLVPSACAGAVSWVGCVVLQHNPTFFPCLSQLYCNTMPSQTIPQSQYNKCIATQPQLPSPSYCNTILTHRTPIAIHYPVLQPTSPSHHTEIVLQYNPLPHKPPLLQYNSPFQPLKGHVTIQYPLSQYNMGSSPS